MLSSQPTSLALADESIHVTFEGTLEHREVPYSFRFNGSDEYAFTRLLCCALIYGMPVDGLEECFSTITDIHQFYSVLPSRVLSPPSTEKVRAALA